VFEAGKAQGGGDNDFWDSFALKKDCDYAFYNWNEKMFKPNGEVVLKGNGSRAFYGFNTNGTGTNQPVSMIEHLKKCGATLNTSKATNPTFMFGSSNITDLPTLDFSNATKLESTFNNSPIEKIEKIILKSDGTQTFTNVTFNCVPLWYIRFDGVIGKDVWFDKCVNLDAESYNDIFTHCSKSTSFTMTLPPLETVLSVYDTKYGTGALDAIVAEYSNITFSYS
jgi:hypothetical protein